MLFEKDDSCNGSVDDAVLVNEGDRLSGKKNSYDL